MHCKMTCHSLAMGGFHDAMSPAKTALQSYSRFHSNTSHFGCALKLLGQIACSTGFSSEIGTKLRDWAVGQAGGSCNSRAALSSNDSKTL